MSIFNRKQVGSFVNIPLQRSEWQYRAASFCNLIISLPITALCLISLCPQSYDDMKIYAFMQNKRKTRFPFLTMLEKSLKTWSPKAWS